MTDLHLFVLCHQAGLQSLRVSILLQQVQGQLLVQALLGQKHVLRRRDRMERRQLEQLSPVHMKTNLTGGQD